MFKWRDDSEGSAAPQSCVFRRRRLTHGRAQRTRSAVHERQRHERQRWRQQDEHRPHDGRQRTSEATHEGRPREGLTQALGVVAVPRVERFGACLGRVHLKPPRSF